MRRFFLFLLLIPAIYANAQFKNDHVKYSNVFPEELCKTLQANPGYILLDVRSQGEFDDTLSSAPGLNLGHIKDALHISVQDLPQRWKELLPYKGKPLFIYCSHSQRSRRASKMLADSGFTKLFNVDGGLTDFYVQGIGDSPCDAYKIVSNLTYKIISPKQLAENYRGGKKYFILDIRSDSSFNGISQSAQANVFGRFKEAVNIPADSLLTSEINIPKDKPLLIVDEYGSTSAKAAAEFSRQGWTDISILINGMDEWLDYVTESRPAQPVNWAQHVPYKIISGDEFGKIMKPKKGLVLIDARPAEQFKNESKNYWENMGNIQDAINIPADNLANSTLLPASKSSPIVLYGFHNQDEIYSAADGLVKKGFTNISVLRGGIWGLRWTSHNIKGKESLNNWVVNVPEQNL